MSVVVYGFLAFLLCRKARSGFRKVVISLTATLITLIALSRLYLGAHWLSDVLGGLSFGVAWIAALAIAYEYQSHERLRPEKFALLMLVTMIIAGGAHIALSHDADRLRYASQPMFPPTFRQNSDPYQQTVSKSDMGGADAAHSLHSISPAAGRGRSNLNQAA